MQLNAILQQLGTQVYARGQQFAIYVYVPGFLVLLVHKAL